MLSPEQTVFTLQRRDQQPWERIAHGVLPLSELPGIVLPAKRQYRRVFGLYTTQASLGFADCSHVVRMERLKRTRISTFATGFDRGPGTTRHDA